MTLAPLLYPVFTVEHYYENEYVIREEGEKLASVTDFKQAEIICKRLNELETEVRETRHNAGASAIEMCCREV